MAEPRDIQKKSGTSPGAVNPPSGESSSHPVATGVGALGGAAAGAAAGMVGGPVGSVIGAVAGAVVGGLGGNAVGRAFDPAEEDRYWRENYAREPYYEAGRTYDDYGPAYTLGLSGRSTYGGSFDEAEPRLQQDWERQRGGSSLSWNQAREPSRAAWQRIDENYPVTGDGELMGSGYTGRTLHSRGDDLGSSSDADLGVGTGGGSTYSTSSTSGTGQGSYGEANTVRSSSLTGSTGRRVDVASGEDMSLSSMPTSDSSIPGSEAFDKNSQRSRVTGSGSSSSSSSRGDAFGAVGSAQSASAGDVSDTDDVVDVLNDLIECCRDGEYGFNLCAEHVQNPELKQRLAQHADECRSAARELMDCIRRLGGDVDDGGSMMGSMHRGWVSVKGTLAGYSDRAMLEEVERGEDAALARYHKALDEKLPSDVHALVQRQADGVKRNHDEMKMWRNRLRDRT